MPVRVEEMANAKTKDPMSTTGWKHIRTAYASITRKLNEVHGDPYKADRLAAIEYCRKRLAEDAASIEAGGDALDPPPE